MKRNPAKYAALTLLIVLLSASSAGAAEIEAEGTPLRKLQRGFLNVALSPFELAHQFQVEKTKPDTLPPNWFIGAARGLAFTGGRALVGIYEMLTFPLPAPAGYAPVLAPEFPWQF